MPFEQRLMQVGQWSLRLLPETPKSIYDLFDLGPNDDSAQGGLFGHIVILPAHLDVIPMTDAILLTAARYTGIFRHLSGEQGGDITIGGPGLAAWMGDEDEKGPIFETEVSVIDGTLSDWVDAILPAGSPLQVGTVTDAGTSPATLSHATIYQTPRQILDYICRMMGAEWRVNMDGTVDVAVKATLWPSNTTPTVIVSRAQGSREPVISGLETIEMVREKDASDYATRVVAIAQTLGFDLAVGAADLGSPTPYKDLFGQAVVIKKLVDAPETLEENADQRATRELEASTMRSVVPLAVDTYDLARYIEPGDAIWVWDPTRNVDSPSGTPVLYQGEMIHPAKLRIYAVTWPVERGMGVYFRDFEGGWWDVSDYVIMEAGTDLDPDAPILGDLPPDPLLEGLRVPSL